MIMPMAGAFITVPSCERSVELAKRYHPDRSNQNTHELMANINAARTIISKCYRVN
jgi:hypothetical protein